MAATSHRTRSKAAPNWTVAESLILVNEICAVESEWRGGGATITSFQKWQQIVDNCNGLEVNRNLNQCKRHWNALQNKYRRRIERQISVDDDSFPSELFHAVDRCITACNRKDEIGEKEEEELPLIGRDLELDSESKDQIHLSSFDKDSKRMKRPWGYSTSSKSNNADAGTQEEILEPVLLENAHKIKATVQQCLDVDDGDDEEAVKTDYIRRRGDELIESIEKILNCLNQLNS